MSSNPHNVKEVREHATAKTSVYRQGELVYDGATGQSVGLGYPGRGGPGRCSRSTT